MDDSPRRWNHNIHYQSLILDAIPDRSQSALDVGCGNGLLSLDLRAKVPEVVGIDLDADVLDNARSRSDEITWIRGDAMTYEFDRQFDVVASIAALHHMGDIDDALARLAELTAPGGVLAVVGLARASRLKDLLLHTVGAVQHRRMVRRREFWDHDAPTVWPPPHDYVTVRRTAERVLPRVRWRQLLLWRYAVVWRRPQ